MEEKLEEKLEGMFNLSDAASSRTKEVNRLQGILNECATELVKHFGLEVHRAPQEEYPRWIAKLVKLAQR